MENRVGPAGHNLAFIVAGLGGQGTEYIPRNVESYLEEHDFKIVYSSWNQFDVSTSGNADANSPEHATFTFGSSTRYETLGFSIPSFISFDVDIGSPNIDEPFVDGALQDLQGGTHDNSDGTGHQYSDNDTIVLIGHSLGGCAVMDLAKSLNDQPSPLNVDVLTALDPVGWSGELTPAQADTLVGSINLTLASLTGWPI